MITLSGYTAADAEAWNALNRSARNGHFLFDRRFMDYHADRFLDASLIARDDGDPIALLPANRVGDALFSHQGLTFGGLVMHDRATTVRVLAIFDRLLEHLRAAGVTRLVYKALPPIYHQRPASEDLYGLFRHGARLVRRDVTTTIDYGLRGAYSQRRLRGMRKAAREQLAYGESGCWGAYWEILSAALRERHGVAPVHSLDEITMLHGRFPESIRLFTAEQAGSVVAGIVVFETARVAHAQYIAASERGRATGALDGLFDHVIGRYAASKRMFDFGISTEDEGRTLNEGLIAQKEEFGGSAVVHDVYEIGC